MNNQFTIIDGLGEPTRILTLPGGVPVDTQLRSGEFSVSGAPPEEPSWYGRAASSWVPRGQQPSEDHVWNPNEKRWDHVPAPAEHLSVVARMQRDSLLSASDWALLPDSPLSAPQRAAWVAYRAALRGIPDQSGFPQDISWPAAP